MAKGKKSGTKQVADGADVVPKQSPSSKKDTKKTTSKKSGYVSCILIDKPSRYKLIAKRLCN